MIPSDKIHEILPKLNTTRDGMFVVPGEDTVWGFGFMSANKYIPTNYIQEYQVCSHIPHDANDFYWILSGHVYYFYSSKEAAILARGTKE